MLIAISTNYKHICGKQNSINHHTYWKVWNQNITYLWWWYPPFINKLGSKSRHVSSAI